MPPKKLTEEQRKANRKTSHQNWLNKFSEEEKAERKAEKNKREQQARAERSKELKEIENKYNSHEPLTREEQVKYDELIEKRKKRNEKNQKKSAQQTEEIQKIEEKLDKSESLLPEEKDKIKEIINKREKAAQRVRIRRASKKQRLNEASIEKNKQETEVNLCVNLTTVSENNNNQPLISQTFDSEQSEILPIPEEIRLLIQQLYDNEQSYISSNEGLDKFDSAGSPTTSFQNKVTGWYGSFPAPSASPSDNSNQNQIDDQTLLLQNFVDIPNELLWNDDEYNPDNNNRSPTYK